ncbi:ribosomal RNA small subunit methyltransferase B [Clostridiales bacterium]|nr:ribosomal RNA small subunit methyltransferase B [Clostridiales bacterium]
MLSINPREITAEILNEISEEAAYNNVALKKYLRQNGAMSRQDRAFVTQCVNGTLRNLIFIDYVIDLFSKTEIKKIKPFILAVMRSAVYQMFFLDKVPDSAACSEAVKLVKKRGLSQLSGYVNGTLRNIARNKNNIELPHKGTLEYISIKYSYPSWILKMWLSSYDYETVEKICAAGNMPPDVSLCVNRLKMSADELINELEKLDIKVERGIYSEDFIHIKGSSDLTKLDAFNNGLFHVQDESSALAVRLLDPQPGEKILDVCAAPGGKSFYAAEKMDNTGCIDSCDIYQHKIELIEQSAVRLGISIISAMVKDGTQIYPENLEKYDRVLVDAPCSGFGLIRKKPDIKINRTGNDIDSLAELQKKILDSSAKYVKKGGVLVYSTCTICRKENENNMKYILDKGEFEPVDIREYLPEELKPHAKDGCIQLLPGMQKTDGFFIAVLKKKGL